MAEQEETIEEQEADKNDPEEKKQKFPIKIVIIFVLFLVVAGGGFFLWKGGVFANLDKKEVPDTKKKTNASKKELGPIFALEPFIVNLVDPHGKKYLKIKLELEMSKVNVQEEIDRRMPQFRDSIVTILSSKSYEDINTFEGKLQLRTEILTQLNQYLANGRINNIFFTEFIVQ